MSEHTPDHLATSAGLPPVEYIRAHGDAIDNSPTHGLQFFGRALAGFSSGTILNSMLTENIPEGWAKIAMATGIEIGSAAAAIVPPLRKRPKKQQERIDAILDVQHDLAARLEEPVELLTFREPTKRRKPTEQQVGLYWSAKPDDNHDATRLRAGFRQIVTGFAATEQPDALLLSAATITAIREGTEEFTEHGRPTHLNSFLNKDKHSGASVILPEGNEELRLVPFDDARKLLELLPPDPLIDRLLDMYADCNLTENRLELIERYRERPAQTRSELTKVLRSSLELGMQDASRIREPDGEIRKVHTRSTLTNDGHIHTYDERGRMHGSGNLRGALGFAGDLDPTEIEELVRNNRTRGRQHIEVRLYELLRQQEIDQVTASAERTDSTQPSLQERVAHRFGTKRSATTNNTERIYMAPSARRMRKLIASAAMAMVVTPAAAIGISHEFYTKGRAGWAAYAAEHPGMKLPAVNQVDAGLAYARAHGGVGASAFSVLQMGGKGLYDAFGAGLQAVGIDPAFGYGPAPTGGQPAPPLRQLGGLGESKGHPGNIGELTDPNPTIWSIENKGSLDMQAGHWISSVGNVFDEETFTWHSQLRYSKEPALQLDPANLTTNPDARYLQVSTPQEVIIAPGTQYFSVPIAERSRLAAVTVTDLGTKQTFATEVYTDQYRLPHIHLPVIPASPVEVRYWLVPVDDDPLISTETISDDEGMKASAHVRDIVRRELQRYDPQLAAMTDAGSILNYIQRSFNYSINPLSTETNTIIGNATDYTVEARLNALFKDIYTNRKLNCNVTQLLTGLTFAAKKINLPIGAAGGFMNAPSDKESHRLDNQLSLHEAHAFFINYDNIIDNTPGNDQDPGEASFFDEKPPEPLQIIAPPPPKSESIPTGDIRLGGEALLLAGVGLLGTRRWRRRDPLFLQKLHHRTRIRQLRQVPESVLGDGQAAIEAALYAQQPSPPTHTPSTFNLDDYLRTPTVTHSAREIRTALRQLGQLDPTTRWAANKLVKLKVSQQKSTP